MHPYLARLQVHEAVQEYFAPYLFNDDAGDLCFSYGDGLEHYGFAFHKVPVSRFFWVAGNVNLAQVSQVLVCASAMEGIAWLNRHWFSFFDTQSLLFLALGASLQQEHVLWLRKHLPAKEFQFVFGKDLLGRLTAIKLAAGIRGQQLHIAYLSEKKIQIRFRGAVYLFHPDELTLHALEKASGYRFRVRIANPKDHNTFFEQLKAGAGLSF